MSCKLKSFSVTITHQNISSQLKPGKLTRTLIPRQIPDFHMWSIESGRHKLKKLTRHAELLSCWIPNQGGREYVKFRNVLCSVHFKESSVSVLPEIYLRIDFKQLTAIS